MVTGRGEALKNEREETNSLHGHNLAGTALRLV